MRQTLRLFALASGAARDATAPTARGVEAKPPLVVRPAFSGHSPSLELPRVAGYQA